MKARTILEAFNTRLPFGDTVAPSWQKHPKALTKALQYGDSEYLLFIQPIPPAQVWNKRGAWHVAFTLRRKGGLVYNSTGITKTAGTGGALSVLSSMAREIADWVHQHRPAYVYFSAQPEKRARIYEKLVSLFMRWVPEYQRITEVPWYDGTLDGSDFLFARKSAEPVRGKRQPEDPAQGTFALESRARALLDEVFQTRLNFGPDAHQQMRDVMSKMGMKPAQADPRYVDKATKVGEQSYRLKIGKDHFLNRPNAYSVIFMLEGGEKNRFGVTGTGNAFRVLGGMANEVKQWAIRALPAYLTFTAEGHTRIRLYAKIVDLFLKEMNGAYVLDQRRMVTPGMELFILRAKRAETTVPEPVEDDPDDDLVY